MTDTESLPALIKSTAADLLAQASEATLEQVTGRMLDLDDSAFEQLVYTAGAINSANKKLLIGATLRIQQTAADGEIMQEMRWLSKACGRSIRTLQTWMAAAVDSGEVTPPPRYLGRRDASELGRERIQEAGEVFRQEGEEAFFGDDDDTYELRGYTVAVDHDDPNWGDSIEARRRHNDLLGGDQMGFGDGSTPDPTYTNPPDTPRPARTVKVEADSLWLETQAAMIQAENPTWVATASERAALGKWNSAVLTEPLELFEDVEMVYTSMGERVPEDLAALLMAAEDARVLRESGPEVITPDEVKQPKKRASGGGSAGKVKREFGAKVGDANATKGMEYARDLHSHIVELLGTNGPQGVAVTYGPARSTIQSWKFTLDSILKKIKEAEEAAADTETTPTDY